MVEEAMFVSSHPHLHPYPNSCVLQISEVLISRRLRTSFQLSLISLNS